MLEQHCFYYHQSIISSKINLKAYFIFPKIKKIVVFFIVNTKYYKKNVLLFYIIVNICFYRVTVSHTKEVNSYHVFKLSFQKIKITEFFNNFVNVYLPTLGFNQNLIKKSSLDKNKKRNNLFYSMCYLHFPVIPETEFLCYTNEYIYNWINDYHIRLDVRIKSRRFFKNSLEFLFRLFRFPIVTKFSYR